jgi:membrane protein DedA with SNARE-associated domain
VGELVVDIFDWIGGLPPVLAYTAILVVAYGENVLPPIPGDMVVVFGGYLVSLGKLSFAGVVVLSTLGGLLGFMTMYLAGRAIGTAVMDPDRFRFIPKHRIERASDWLSRWGYGVVALNRFLSGLRSVISLSVGIARMDPWKTSLWAAVSAVVWTSLIAFLGYELGENWESVSAYLRQYGAVVTILIVGVLLFQTARYLLNRRSERPPIER